MSNPKQTASVLQLLVDAYPNFADRVTEDTVRIYTLALQDLPSDALKGAILDHISSHRYFPSIAELRERAFDLMPGAADELDAYQAWEEALGYVRVGRGHPICGQGEWDIPDAIEAAVRQIGGWSYLARSENSVPDRARFVDAYERAQKRRMRRVLALPQVAELAARLARPAAERQLAGTVIESE